jgi:hypothetical protein
MTNDDIIRMAKQAKLPYEYDTGRLLYLHELNRFVRLIEEHLKYDGIHTCHDKCLRPACVAIRSAVAAEREACADICDQHSSAEGIAERCAEAIRARGER